jgi:hypothetical protein
MILMSCTEALLSYSLYQVRKLVVQVWLGVIILTHRSGLEQATSRVVFLYQHLSTLDYLKAKQRGRMVQDNYVHGSLAHLL